MPAAALPVWVVQKFNFAIVVHDVILTRNCIHELRSQKMIQLASCQWRRSAVTSEACWRLMQLERKELSAQAHHMHADECH